MFSIFSEIWDIYKTAGGLIIKPLWLIIKNWWWLFFPFLIKNRFLFFWKWWRFEAFLKNVFRPVLLEIKIPKDIVKPIRAMEDVMTSLHSIIYHPPDWWEEWIEGQFQTSLGLEIASIEGKIHFYIRIHEAYRDAVEAAIYSQYPEVEIVEVDDYTKLVPQDIPNKEWEMWGTDYRFLKNKIEENALPILTYKKFETGQEDVEEKKVDPIAELVEALGRMGPGEHFWIQIAATPVSEQEDSVKTVGFNWIEEGKKLRDKLAKRPVEEKKPYRPIILDAIDFLITGKVPEEPEKPEKEKFFLPPEMKLTPGEREIVAAIEEKISKPGFYTNIRFIYLGKRKNFVKGKLRLGFTFFGSFYTHNLNALIPYGDTITKIHRSWFLPINLFRARRLYLRKRKLFRNYVSRVHSYFPRPPKNVKFILNTEELASIFHFPSWRIAPVPGVSWIEAKKKPPPELPEQ